MYISLNNRKKTSLLRDKAIKSNSILKAVKGIKNWLSLPKAKSVELQLDFKRKQTEVILEVD